MALYKRDIEEIRRLTRNAGKKVYRLNQKEILGSMVDPRRPNKDIYSMSRKELNEYKKRLREFNSRSNQYVRGAMGVPLQKSVWDDFVRARDKANASLAKQNARFADVMTHNGMTVAQYMAMTRPVHPELEDPAANAYWEPNRINAVSFASEKAIKKKMKSMEERQDPMFLKKQARKYKRVAMQMMEESGDIEALKRLKKLSLDQFDMLWRFTPFARNASAKYESAKKGLWDDKTAIGRAIDSEIYTYLSWAEKVEVGGKE